MDSLNLVLLLGASLLFVGLALGSLGARLGVPSLLVFLVVGMVAGVDGAGLRFNDFETGYLVSNLALAVIDQGRRDEPRQQPSLRRPAAAAGPG